MATAMSVPTPKTPTRRELSRDDRLRIQTLYFDTNWDRTKICLQTNFTYDQINYALTHRLTPQKQKTGRHVVLNTPQRKRLIEWVTASPENRETQ
ncbi:actin associated Wsp1 protein [Rutstroemia sp. NJR-2017a BBW]|nr:actin associated Wsp1 protein [Rutstroemia sp. NJR-2017a BBW]